MQGPAGSYTTSSQLASAISDETGTGSLVFATSPSISGITLTGTLTAGGGTGTSGQVLSSTGTGIQWATAVTDATPTALLYGGM